MIPLEEYELNLSKLTHYNKPAMLRVDLNLPVSKTGDINIRNPRMQIYSKEIALLSEYCKGLVVITHQGKPKKPDCINLDKHVKAVEHLTGKKIELIRPGEIFSEITKDKIRRMRDGEIIFFDNIRLTPGETEPFDLYSSPIVNNFKDIVFGINDAIPTWHRDNDSVVAMAYLKPAKIGFRSMYELKILDYLKKKFEEGDLGIVLGGGKIEKSIDYLPALARKSPICLGGVLGMVGAKVRGYDLGEKNEKFLSERIKPEFYDIYKELGENLYHPKDFVVESDSGERIVRTLEEMKNSKEVIKDIGPETVDYYLKFLCNYSTILMGGPLGVWEDKYLNTLEIAKGLIGKEINVLGGDTGDMLKDSGLLDIITDLGGRVLVSGGAGYHYIIGKAYPYIVHLITQRYPMRL